LLVFLRHIARATSSTGSCTDHPTVRSSTTDKPFREGSPCLPACNRCAATSTGTEMVTTTRFSDGD
jgi:hypothetical protein